MRKMNGEIFKALTGKEPPGTIEEVDKMLEKALSVKVLPVVFTLWPITKKVDSELAKAKEMLDGNLK